MFRFSIRDVLWLTVVVAALVAWCIEHRNASMWRLRANGARMALQDADRKAGWLDDGIAVQVPFPGTTANGLKVFRSK